MLFLFCVAGLVYVIAGYPLLLAALARWGGRPDRMTEAGGSEQPMVSILLPVHNGERWIQRKLDSIFALAYPADRIEVLVVADGCTDRTAELAAEYPVQLISIPKSGKAVALNRAMEQARGEILFSPMYDSRWIKTLCSAWWILLPIPKWAPSPESS